MHHYQIVAKKEGEEYDGLVLASYTPGKGYAMHVSRKQMMEYMQDYAGDEPFTVVLQKGDDPAKAEEPQQEALPQPEPQQEGQESQPSGRRRSRAKDDKPEDEHPVEPPQEGHGSPLAPF